MVQVIKRAAMILDTISTHAPVTFTELQQRIDLHKATLSHILKTLVQLEYAAKNSEGKYEIGHAIQNLARPLAQRNILLEAAEEQAGLLAEELRETVTIGTLCNGERFNLAKATVDQSISVNSRLEQRPSPYETATGRVLLSGLSESELNEIIDKKGMPGADWPKVRSRAQIRKELARIREQGVAARTSADGQVEALAVPVFGPDGRTCAAIGVSAPAYRLQARKRKTIIVALRAAAARMAQNLVLRGMPPCNRRL